ncbi:excinuclease ABC subunit UvrC, partial [bacterium]|nr:excinuclease ABC subunit UvrC [bacterium]
MSSRNRQKNGRSALERKLRLLPNAPGVYLHKDKRGKVIYVGKAARLRPRVASYFQRSGEHDPKTEQLVGNIADVDYIATANEAEALVLEDQLIKEYRPRYNIRLKDDKRYPYLRVTLQEPYPRVEVVRRIVDDGARYFGPYTNVRAMRETLKHVSRVFQVRTCHLDLPEQTVPRPCLDWQIGRCSAPCVDYDTQVAYGRRVLALIRYLAGQERGLLDELRAEMSALSSARRYEEAAKVRDRLALLEAALDGVGRVYGLTGDLDACGVVRDGTTGCGVVLRIRGGKIMTSHHFLLEDRLASDTPAFLAQLCREYYPRAGDLPSVVLVSHVLPDKEQWRERLSGLCGRRVAIVRPRRGPRKESVDMALANAAHKLNEHRLRDQTRVRRVAPGRALALQDA